VGPAIFTVTNSGPVTDRLMFIDDQNETFWILDVAGETVIIHLDSSPAAAQHTRDLATAQPIIDSFVFAP
jgi:hypothetical protein